MTRGEAVSKQRLNTRQTGPGSARRYRGFTASEQFGPLPDEHSRTSSMATVAQNENITRSDSMQRESSVQRISRPLPRARKKDDGWAKTKTVSDLTPEEEALRDALKKKAAAEEESRVRKANMSSEGHGSKAQESSTRSFRWKPVGQPSATATAREMASASSSPSSVDQDAWRPPSDPVSKPVERRDFLQGSTRNAMLDDHIAQSRATEQVLRVGGWHCPDCGYHNFRQNEACKKCQRAGRPTQQGTGIEDEALLAKGWKLVRRPQAPSSPPPVQPQQPEKHSSPPDPQAVDQARAFEDESMMRMARTKNGSFVSFGGRQSVDGMGPTELERALQKLDGSDLLARTPMVDTFSTSDSEFASGWTTQKPRAASNPAANERETSKEDLPPILPKGHYKSGDHRRASRSKDGWKRWESEKHAQYESSSYPEVPTPESRAERIVTYTPISTAGTPSEQGSRDAAEPPQLFRTMESVPWHDLQRQGERDLPREARMAREAIITSSPFVSQGNRDRARRSNKQYVSKSDKEEAYEDDEDLLADRRMERKEQRKRAKAAQKAAAPPTPIYLPEFISVSNLADVLKVRVEDFLYKMKELGFEEMNNDHVLDAETAGLVAAEFNCEPIIDREEDRDIHPLPPAEDKSLLSTRPPVVTIMGHVDHGKTTLLDYLRKSSVAASEHGGITQHIGAFSVLMPGGRLVTFLDTPGHEAFLSMRQRGANVTDIVILVVAADDSVKPQTIEAIKHARAAKVPMIVAVNKIDREDSDVEKVKQDLARYGVEIEDYGGDTQVVCVSGKTGQGMEELEDAAVALADILDMRAETDGQAEGWVLEATTKKAGRVATILVRRGTLRPGDVIVAGKSWARVRSLRNEAGTMVALAGPGTPVEIDGWREQPAAGDEVIQAPDEQKAKSVVDYRLEVLERTRLAADMEVFNEARRLEQEKRDQLEKAAELAVANPEAPAEANAQESIPPTAATAPTFQEVFFIIKGDVSGSVEAVTNSVSALGNSEVRPHILRSGVGPVTEFDIDHAAVAKGHIINFNTTIEGPIQRMAEVKDVQILDHSIIYRLTDDVRRTLGEKLPAIVKQRVLGEAEIGQLFEINTKGRVMVPIAGCRVRNGVIGRTSKIRVLRGKEIVYDGMFYPLLGISYSICLLLAL